MEDPSSVTIAGLEGARQCYCVRSFVVRSLQLARSYTVSVHLDVVLWQASSARAPL